MSPLLSPLSYGPRKDLRRLLRGDYNHFYNLLRTVKLVGTKKPVVIGVTTGDYRN